MRQVLDGQILRPVLARVDGPVDEVGDRAVAGGVSAAHVECLVRGEVEGLVLMLGWGRGSGSGAEVGAEDQGSERRGDENKGLSWCK